jgi:hypothetical protein
MPTDAYAALDNPTLDLRPMQQIVVSMQAMMLLRDDMAFEKVLNCGRFCYERPALPEGCYCLEDLKTYQLQEITGRSDFPRDLLLILARYLAQREYALEVGQKTRYKTAEELTASFLKMYSHRRLARAVVDDGTPDENGSHRRAKKAEGKAIYLRYSLPSAIPTTSPIHPSNLAPPRGQGLLIRDWIIYREDPLSAFTYQEVTDALVRNGFTCNQDPYRAIRWVLDEWTKKGYLVKK